MSRREEIEAICRDATVVERDAFTYRTYRRLHPLVEAELRALRAVYDEYKRVAGGLPACLSLPALDAYEVDHE
jgi:hypothetical protein